MDAYVSIIAGVVLAIKIGMVRLLVKIGKSIAAKLVLNMRGTLERVDGGNGRSPASAHRVSAGSNPGEMSARPYSRRGGVVLTMLAAIWGANSACAQQVEPARALALMKNYDCMNCHGIDKKVVGPAFSEVAAKYKGDASAAAKLMEKVRNGGSKVWGPVPMPPNPKVSDADLKTIVAYILTLTK